MLTTIVHFCHFSLLLIFFLLFVNVRHISLIIAGLKLYDDVRGIEAPQVMSSTGSSGLVRVWAHVKSQYRARELKALVCSES